MNEATDLSSKLFPEALPAGDRRAAIVAAALEIFMRYGFGRTTMDDIAAAAGISRPALYRDFRNKADIYKALAELLLDRAATAAEKVLAGDGPLKNRLQRALDVGILDHLIAISQSPHGAEILEQKHELTDEVIAGWRDRVATAIAASIAAQAKAAGIDLQARGFSPDSLAGALLDGLDGAKHRSSDPQIWRSAAARQIDLVMLALR
jgi:AcrR family transcriptional regulator